MTTARRATGTVPSSSRTSDVVVYVLSRSDATAHGATCAAGPWGGAACAHGGGGGCWGRTVASVQAYPSHHRWPGPPAGSGYQPGGAPGYPVCSLIRTSCQTVRPLPHIPFGGGQYARRMRIFVAGGTGAIGRPLVSALVAAGHEVTVFSRSADRVAGLGLPGVVPAVGDALSRRRHAVGAAGVSRGRDQPAD